MPDHESAIATYREQEETLVFMGFDQAAAWSLGSRIAEKALAAGHAVVVDIRRPGFVLFTAALPGSTPDQAVWAAKKAAVVLRLEKSSALAAAQFEAMDFDPSSIGWLSKEEYALTPGSFPIRVQGVGVVAAVSVSGLSSEGDHALIIDTLREWLAIPDAGARG